MKQANPFCLAVIVGALVAACSGESDSSNDGSTIAQALVSPSSDDGFAEIIAQFRIGEITVQFSVFAESPEPSVGILTGGLRGDDTSPIDDLVAEYGPLTELELFFAFAPDAEPPPVLVALHPAVALRLGRPDATVRHVPPLTGVIVEI